MIFSDTLEAVKIAVDSMLSNKLRSLLASLGVVIGISFVIIMGWVLGGLDSALEDTINIIGKDMLYVDQWDWTGGRRWKEQQYRKPISLEQANDLCQRLEHAELVIPLAMKWITSVKYANEVYTGISVQGTKSDFGLTPAGTIIEGRFFTPSEDKMGTNVAVIGHGVYSTLFTGADPIGKELKVNGKPFLIIGVVKKQATYLTDFMDQRIYVPMNAFIGLFGNFRRSFSIAVKAGSIEKMDEVRSETEGLMREIRNLKPGQENDFSINETKAFEETFMVLRLVVWSIGIGMTVLSFIVGIIGIMNIMFVSVAERTKEIGIRKAIGARRSSILQQFIIESATLCLIGSVFSFAGCSIMIYLVATILPIFYPSFAFLKPFIPFDLLLIATIVSVIVGILAGIIPATRAARLNPVDALRYE